MNEKGIGELRRRFRPDKTSVTHIRGCYVNEKGEIVSEFTQALSLMTEDEAEKMLALLRKALSGSLGQQRPHLIQILENALLALAISQRSKRRSEPEPRQRSRRSHCSAFLPS